MNDSSSLDHALRISRINVRRVVVPLARPVITANGAVDIAPLLLVDITTNSGVTGRAYAFAYSPAFLPALSSLATELYKPLIDAPLVPQKLEAQLRARFTLLGGATNLAAFAVSVFDMAAWDAFARHLRVPLSVALGAAPKATQAYAGNGVGVVPNTEIEKTIDAVLADGVAAIKLRLGRTHARDDVRAIETAKTLLEKKGKGDMPVMVDFNQSLNVPEALARCAAIDHFNLVWIEEPTRCDDWKGNAAIAAATRTPIQIGENIASAYAMNDALSAKAMDFTMIDAQQIGGVTGWLRAAAVARAHGVPVSSHLFVEYSAHLLAATPGAAWLEYFPLADPILRESCTIIDGALAPIPGNGSGIEWDEEAVAKFAV